MIFHFPQLPFIAGDSTFKGKQGVSVDMVKNLNRKCRAVISMFKNTNKEDDPGMIAIREAEAELGDVTKDDAYRIMQLEYAYFFGGSPRKETGKILNWAWKLGVDDKPFEGKTRALFLIMLSGNGYLKPSELYTKAVKLNEKTRKVSERQKLGDDRIE